MCIRDRCQTPQFQMYPQVLPCLVPVLDPKYTQAGAWKPQVKNEACQLLLENDQELQKQSKEETKDRRPIKMLRKNIKKKPFSIKYKYNKEKLDTKNLVKNFVNAFLNYLKTTKDTTKNQNFCQALYQLQQLISQSNYNRTLLKGIVETQIVKEAFEVFLKEQCFSWIMYSSNIKDKQSHMRARRNFLYICQNYSCLLYTSPSPRDRQKSRMPSSA
eukprot:TRINITY_DN7925_c0_g1_i4.p1 TRINITY_DN7925_c0_g1~~TRINITY_DN7925_c0_g1_i4.p1  ORF type:complete len:216 (-),score=35.37 TRINITY_DN7925_c0_g1_i4:13-660(-)